MPDEISLCSPTASCRPWNVTCVQSRRTSTIPYGITSMSWPWIPRKRHKWNPRWVKPLKCSCYPLESVICLVSGFTLGSALSINSIKIGSIIASWSRASIVCSSCKIIQRKSLLFCWKNWNLFQKCSQDTFNAFILQFSFLLQGLYL